MITVQDIEGAAARIAGHVRRTPVVQATQLVRPPTAAELWLKLECLQATGSFKARGATNRLLTTPPEQLRHGIVTASGGNHGLATARAARLAGVPAVIYVPQTVTAAKVAKLKQWGAEVRVVGTVWDEANRDALAFAEATGGVYFHPFADPAVVAGQGTLGLELLADLPEVEAVLIAIGGGGLIAGMATALKARRPGIRVIGIEAAGSPTLLEAFRAGAVVTLPAVTTRVATMACGRTDERVFALARAHVDEIVLVTDEEMLAAARWLWFEMGLAADLSGAAAIAALLAGKVTLPAGMRVAAIVCGAGPEGLADA